MGVQGFLKDPFFDLPPISFSMNNMYWRPKADLETQIWLWIISLLPAKSRKTNTDLATDNEFIASQIYQRIPAYILLF